MRKPISQPLKTVVIMLALVSITSPNIAAFSVISQQHDAAKQENVKVLPDGTEFTVVTTDEITSKTAAEGDPLTFKVAEDVKIDGQVVIAKDTLVKGVVATAKKAGMMGRGGSLGIRVEATMTAHVPRPLRDTSRRTLPVTPLLVHAMRRWLLIVHPSPPFGAVRVSVAARGPARLCSAAAMSATPSR